MEGELLSAEIRVSHRRQQELRQRFWALHRREVVLACSIARTLAIVAIPGDAAATEYDRHCFNRGYRVISGQSTP